MITLDLARHVPRLRSKVVAIATTVKEGIEQAAAGHPDLILVDIGLTGVINRLKAAARICAQRSIPVVYLAGYLEINPLDGVIPSGPPHPFYIWTSLLTRRPCERALQGR
jgi:CheY-like chemotaxis protein